MLSKHLLWIYCLVSTLCLVTCFGINGRWEIILIFLAVALLVFFFRKQMGDWFPSIMLVLYLLVACVGLIMELMPVWMIFGVTAALASWDLAQFSPKMENGGRSDLMAYMEQRHIQFLSLSLGLGLLLALAGFYIRFQLSFGLMVLSVLLVLGCLYRFYQLISK